MVTINSFTTWAYERKTYKQIKQKTKRGVQIRNKFISLHSILCHQSKLNFKIICIIVLNELPMSNKDFICQNIGIYIFYTQKIKLVFDRFSDKDHLSSNKGQ